MRNLFKTFHISTDRELIYFKIFRGLLYVLIIFSSFRILIYQYYIIYSIIGKFTDYNSFIELLREHILFISQYFIYDLIIPITIYGIVALLDHFIDDYEEKIYILNIIKLYKDNENL